MASSPIHASSLPHSFGIVDQEFCFEESILEIYFGHDYSACDLQQTICFDPLNRYWTELPRLETILQSRD